MTSIDRIILEVDDVLRKQQKNLFPALTHKLYEYYNNNDRETSLKTVSNINRININFCDLETNQFKTELCKKGFIYLFDIEGSIEENFNIIQFFFTGTGKFIHHNTFKTEFIEYLLEKIPISSEQEKINLAEFVQPYPDLAFEQIKLLLPAIVNENDRPLLYRDSQNVHNSKIQDCIRYINKNIFVSGESNIFKLIRDIENIFTDFPNYDLIKKSLNRIETDTSDINLQKMLFNVWNKIKQSKHSEELTKRLGEELTEMSGMCVTGFSTRLINVFSGFPDEQIGIVIMPEEEITRLWNYKMMLSINNDEDLLIGMIDKSSKYLEFIKEFKETFKKEVEISYSDIFSSEFTKDKMLQLLDKLEAR